jgi:urease accessory protein
MACVRAWQYDPSGEPIRNVHAGGWRGKLVLRYERRVKRTVLAERRHLGPILVQRPFYPEGEEICHGIVLHPPGGIVGGDELELEASVLPDAAVLLTTPGATKWYRSAGLHARQRLKFEVMSGASLEWLPQPTIAFDRALGRAETEIALDATGRYIGWELLCLGRTAAGERFREGRMQMSVKVLRSGEPLWLERACIDGGSRLLDSPVGLAGQPVTGTLLAASPAVDAVLVKACRVVQPSAGRSAVTRLPGLIVARYLGAEAEPGHDYFVRLWRVLRPALLGRTAEPPRIWRT